MGSAYAARLVALLGAVAREGRSGRVFLAAEAGGVLHFGAGSLTGFEPPDGAAGAAALAPPGKGGAAAAGALRQRITQTVLAAAAHGVNPEIRPAAPGGRSPAPGGLTAADLALDAARMIEDVLWLRTQVSGEAQERLGPPPAAPAAPPRLALGAAEGFLLSRADGSMTVAEILRISPLAEIETLRSLYALRAAGMLAGCVAAPGEGRTARQAPPVRRLAVLDQFLKKTSAAVPPARPAPSAAGASGPPSRFTPEQERERQALIQRCADVSQQDHYQILEVERGAPEASVRQAYYKIARRLHPDRLRRPHLEEILPDLERMFAQITEAYNTLSDAAARAVYDRELCDKAGGRKGATVDRQASGRESFQRGRKAMDAGQTYEAIQLFEAALQVDPTRAEVFHYLGLCQGQNPRWKKKAEENLLKAIDLNPGAVQSYLELARLYKKGGLERRAAEMYEQVLKWEPTNEEAIAATSRHAEAGSATGIFRAMFKKD